MYKLVISDFKDTIIDKEGSISTDTIISIDNYRRNGGLFCICSEINYEDVLYYDKSFHFIDYIISYSGSVIYDVNKEKIIYDKHILISKIKKIIKNIDKVVLYNINSKYKVDSNYLDYLSNNKIYRIDIPNNKDNLEFIKELDVNYYVDDKKIIITGSNIYDCINKIIKKKITYREVLCIPNDNKFLCCTDLFYCIGLSNCKIKVKKIKLDNNHDGVLEILNNINKA